jgi:hypothetical protein
VWTGALVDPGFQNADAWNVSNGATVLAFNEEVEKDRGKAFLEPSVVCNAGEVSQDIEMPPYEAADPFVVEVTYRAEPSNGFEVGFDRAWKRLPQTPGDTWKTERFCIGEAAYGGTVTLRMASSEKTMSCSSTETPSQIIEVDRVEIQTAMPGDACPAPGEVVNGVAVPEGGGWTFIAQGDATAGYAEDAGDTGTSALDTSAVRLYSPRGSPSDGAAMTTTVSVPLLSTMASPALQFWWKGTSGALFQTELGTLIKLGVQDRPLGTLVGVGSGRNALYCLPPWTHGNVVDLSFEMIDFRPEQETELPEQETELVVDSLAVVSDPRCGDSVEIHDPGFESAPVDRPGTALYKASEQSFQMVEDSERAHGGNGYLEINYWTTSGLAIMESWVLVPPPDENGGPEVTFYGNVPTDPVVPVRWFVGLVSELEGDVLKGGWRLNQGACLPPEWGNRWYRFHVGVGGPGAPPQAVIDPPKSVLIDDLAVGTSPRCSTD